jgi:hypothetical protein
MLRDVLSKHIKPRIIPFRADTASITDRSVQKGYGDYVFSTGGTGLLTLTHRDGFSRAGLVFSVGTTGDGGYVAPTDTTGQVNAFTIKSFDKAGNAAAATIEGFCYGWGSSDLSLSKVQRVRCSLNDSRIIWGKITGLTGAVAFGTGDFSCTRASAGDYTVTFKRPFCQTPVVMVTGVGTSAAATTSIKTAAASRTASSVRIIIAPNSGTPADADFYIVVVGQDTKSDSGKNRNILQNSQRKSRIVAAQIINTAGTWSWGTGGTAGALDFASTITDNGAGDFSITLQELFKREPAIIVSTTTQRSQVHSYTNSTGVLRILTKAANDTNTDVSGITNIFMIGSDDPSEY